MPAISSENPTRTESVEKRRLGRKKLSRLENEILTEQATISFS
jgi:hypothetical protein